MKFSYLSKKKKKSKHIVTSSVVRIFSMSDIREGQEFQISLYNLYLSKEKSFLYICIVKNGRNITKSPRTQNLKAHYSNI